MEDTRMCIACRADLVGPLQPKIALTRLLSGEETLQVAARAWVCSGCGLVHWYAADESFDHLEALARDEPEAAPTPGEDYERRAQMLHMLRRVRRM